MNGPIPDISILMTVFNTEAYLAEAIDSVLHQHTACSWELIVVDDGSTDGSLRIARQYAARHRGCIRVLQHPRGINRGISASRNLALRHACGEITAFLDSDDVWLPHHLQTQADLLLQHSDVDMVYANAERWVHADRPFDEGAARRAWWGENYVPPLVPPGQAPGLLAPGTLLQWFLEDESMVPCICTVLVRTAAARAVGGFRDEFRGLFDDQAFHALIAVNHNVYANDVCVARYRQHSHSCCAVGHADRAIHVPERDRFHSFLKQLPFSAKPASSLVAQREEPVLVEG